MTPQQTLVPIPDPTLLTTAQLKVAIDNLKELLSSNIDDNYKLLNERINANDKRIEDAWTHRLEVKEDAKTAITAALSAAKELNEQQRKCASDAAEKAEKSFTKQIEALGSESRISREALSARISLLETANAQYIGKKEQHHEAKDFSQWIIGLIIITAISLVGDVIMMIHLFSKP